MPRSVGRPLAVLLALTGCQAPAASAPGATPAPSATAPRRPIVQVLPSREFGFLPAVIAVIRGFFAVEGLDADLRVMLSNAAIPALINKEVQIATAGSAIRVAYQGALLPAPFYTCTTTIRSLPSLLTTCGPIRTFEAGLLLQTEIDLEAMGID